MKIQIMQRVKQPGKEHYAKFLCMYSSDFVPRKGDLMDLSARTTYEVVQVIFCLGSVIVEVAEYNTPDNPPLSKCPQI